MAFEANYKTINTSYRKSMGDDQQAVECTLQARQNTIISKVVCTKVVACTQDTEVLNGQAKYTAKVRFEVIYASEGGDLHSINETVLVAGTVENPDLSTGMYALTDSEIIDSKIVNVNDNAISLSGILDTSIDCMITDEIECLESVSDEVVAKKDVMTYCVMSSAQKDKFRVVEELEVKEDIGRLLMATVNICTNEITAGTNYITVNGTMNVNLTYETSGEDKELKSVAKTIAFKEEIEAEGVKPECFVNMVANVRHDEVNIFGNIVDGSTLLKMSIVVCYNYAATHQEQTDVIVDAFATEQEATLVAESFYKCKFDMQKKYSEKFSNNITIENGEYEVEEIIANCGGGAYVANSYCTEGYVMIEGVAHCNVVYSVISEEEEKLYRSVHLELPYAMEMPCEEATTNSENMISVAVKDLALINMRGKEIEIVVELCAYVYVWENEQDMVVSNIEMSEMMEDDATALKMYLIKKESNLWDVCKKVMADPEAVMLQNPDLEFPLAEDTIIVMYKQKGEMY